MAQYIPPNYQQPYQESRSRGSSNASANRYVPESYGGPAPPQQPPYPTGYAAAPRARGPSFGDSQIPSIPPVPETQPFHPAPGFQPPNGQLHPAHAAQQPPYPKSGVDREGYMRAPSAPRRSSHSSNHSQRSHKSHHSGHSHDSRRSEHSHRSDYFHRDRRSSDRERRSSDYDDGRRSRSSRREREDRDRDLPPPKRVNSHRPSWGDSIYSMFNVIKDALGPRDKY